SSSSPFAPHSTSLFFFFTTLPPPSSSLFPYTTLFRSKSDCSTCQRRRSTVQAALHRPATYFACTAARNILRRPLLGVEDRPSPRSEEHTSELQSLTNLVCRLLLQQKNQYQYTTRTRYL